MSKQKKVRKEVWTVNELSEKYGKLPIENPDKIVKKVLTKNPKENSKKKE